MLNIFQHFATWWSIRCIYAHQNVLEDPSNILHSTFDEHLVFLSELCPWLAKIHQIKSDSNEEEGIEAFKIRPLESEFEELKDPLLRQLRTLFWTEVAQVRLCYSQVHKARDCVEQALDAGKMHLSLTGL
jgi:hypothetical protein